jgi:hypothetical protein
MGTEYMCVGTVFAELVQGKGTSPALTIQNSMRVVNAKSLSM